VEEKVTLCVIDNLNYKWFQYSIIFENERLLKLLFPDMHRSSRHISPGLFHAFEYNHWIRIIHARIK